MSPSGQSLHSVGVAFHLFFPHSILSNFIEFNFTIFFCNLRNIINCLMGMPRTVGSEMLNDKIEIEKNQVNCVGICFSMETKASPTIISSIKGAE